MTIARAKVRPSPTSRSVPEWIGRTPDSEPPPHVVRRIFDTHNGRCHITHCEIDPVRDEWHVEHVKSLRNGGQNRETNMAPAIIQAHLEKTAAENSAGAKADRIREKHLGLHKRKGRPMAGCKDSPFKQKIGRRGRESWERRL